MNLWKRLFGRSTPKGTQARPSPSMAAGARTVTGGPNWYFAEDKARCTRQIVLTSDPVRKTASRFATLMFSGKYRKLLANPLAIGFFRLDGQPGPFLLLRTDPAVEEMANETLSIAFSFYFLPTSGIIAMYVSSKLLKNETRMGFCEEIYGLDYDETRSLIADAIRKDSLYVVHAGASGSITEDVATGNVYNNPACKYDIVLPFSAECKKRLANEWSELLSYHERIRKPDFDTAVRLLYEMVPEDIDPILPRTKATR